jgi:hypothetical protein
MRQREKGKFMVEISYEEKAAVHKGFDDSQRLVHCLARGTSFGQGFKWANKGKEVSS